MVVSGGVRLGFLVLALMVCLDRREAAAQLGALVSPGRLSKAHESLEGADKCLSCHSAGRRVAVEKCLQCHQPIAQRIAAKRGVHRGVTNDCVTCHVEHAGVDGELRPFDLKKFNHAVDGGFPLDGLHAPKAAECSTCHKTRSFLTASANCASCHQDPHKGSLGAGCITCHPTSVRFAATRATFDHSRTTFPLTGAHTTVDCNSCHANGVFKRAVTATCATCHTDPHKRTFGGACASCHGTGTWRTTKIDHARTAFPLRGQHASVACASCHTKSALSTPVAHDTCATCHSDPHRGTFKQDCSSCHTESSFSTGRFDHATTRFALADGHAGLTCARCHKNSSSLPSTPVRTARGRAVMPVDFRGLSLSCASCHDDPHQKELGTSCEACHSARTFRVGAFTHARQRPFFEGGHAAVRCEQCHVPSGASLRAAPKPVTGPRMARVGLPATPTDCASCHQDVHLGQVGARCETCHAIDVAKFGVTGFSHARTAFPLVGRHAQTVCAQCHRSETGTFPAGIGTAVRLTGLGSTCATCHVDPHAGEVGTRCEQCHSAETFRVRTYTHRNAASLSWFFAGAHLKAGCQTCHKAGTTAAGAATALRYRIATTCTDCHDDKHRGALGPRCENCHRLR